MHDLPKLTEFVKVRFRRESQFAIRQDKDPSDRLKHQERAGFYLALEEILCDLVSTGYVPPSLRARGTPIRNSEPAAPLDDAPPTAPPQDIGADDSRNTDNAAHIGSLDPFSQQILQVFHHAQRMLSINEVHQLHDDMFHEDLPRLTISNKLYKMSERHLIERPVGRKGFYRLPRNQ